MLKKFISVLETHFQNTETALKNQQTSIQGLENQIGQLAKMISERLQGSLPSNTKTNPRVQLHAITIRDEEGLTESESESRQETVVSNGKVKETPRKNMTKPQSSLHKKNRTNNEERILQIDELDEWRTHIKEKPRIHDEPKRLHGELKDRKNQFKIGDQVLLDKMDPQIATSELNANEATPFTVLNIFPHDTVEVNHSKFGTFKVNITRLKPFVDNRNDNEK
ncbi:hypothetical protein GOBAR_AA08327 [Gossypium barbadense]|uniref:Uncharacterized protein n=1 Tax=Gossypium barbadense TaxID=3634 RepID=A0A2P5Y9S0_GOSBA|nr:hypothetical protein GOBAR_AA08327 [Gossypium barbadense]